MLSSASRRSFQASSISGAAGTQASSSSAWVSRRVRVSGLPRSHTLAALTSHIASLVGSVTHRVDRVNEIKRDTAWVIVSAPTPAELNDAVSKINGSTYLGRVISARTTDESTLTSNASNSLSNSSSNSNSSSATSSTAAVVKQRSKLDFFDDAQRERRAAESAANSKARDDFLLPDLLPERNRAQSTPVEELEETGSTEVQLAPLDHALLFEAWVPLSTVMEYPLMPLQPPNTVPLERIAYLPGTFGLAEELVHAQESTANAQLSSEQLSGALMAYLRDNAEEGLQRAMSPEGEFSVSDVQISRDEAASANANAPNADNVNANAAPAHVGQRPVVVRASIGLKGRYALVHEWASVARAHIAQALRVPRARVVTLYLPSPERDREGQLYVALYPPKTARDPAQPQHFTAPFLSTQRDIVKALYLRYAKWQRDQSEPDRVVIRATVDEEDIVRSATEALHVDGDVRPLFSLDPALKRRMPPPPPKESATSPKAQA